MSDKTNQATPTPGQGQTFDLAAPPIKLGTFNDVASLLAENEKLRGAMEEINKLQSDGNLLTSGVLLQKIQSIARAALIGEQKLIIKPGVVFETKIYSKEEIDKVKKERGKPDRIRSTRFPKFR